MTRTATIRLQALAAIALVSSTEETRYYLNGVLLEIEPRTVTYVATDGHRLASHHHELAETDPDNTLLGDFIIPTEHCRPFKLTPTGLRLDPRATLSSTDGAVLELAYGVNAIRFAPIDGTFPDWRRVIPSTVDGVTAQYNAEYLAGLQKVGEILGAGKLPVLSHNGDGPALVTWEDPMTFAVLMPHRTDAPAKRAPYWAAPLPEFAKVA